MGRVEVDLEAKTALGEISFPSPVLATDGRELTPGSEHYTRDSLVTQLCWWPYISQPFLVEVATTLLWRETGKMRCHPQVFVGPLLLCT